MSTPSHSPYRCTLTGAVAVLALLAGAGPALAQDASLEEIKAALEKYQDPYVAVHDLYLSTVGCIVYPEGGAEGQMQYPPGGMGVHFLNVSLIDNELDPLRPEVLIYERAQDGTLHLAAAEWFVPLEASPTAPELFGRKLDGPMEGHQPLMPAGFHHWDLHVWLWKDNPAGMFVPTNPNVTCPGEKYTVHEHAPKLVGPGH